MIIVVMFFVFFVFVIVDYMGFVGVMIVFLLIMKVFLLWVDIFGFFIWIFVGYDLLMDVDFVQYCVMVEQICNDFYYCGVFVIMYKMNVYVVVVDLFDEFDLFVVLCVEIFSIVKCGFILFGCVKDLIMVDLVLCDFFFVDYFVCIGVEVVIFGVGGFGIVLSWVFVEWDDVLVFIIVMVCMQDKFDYFCEVYCQYGIFEGLFCYVVIEMLEEVDVLVMVVFVGLVIVNVIGFGKDCFGLFLIDVVVFFEGVYVWEFNYCGLLEFLYQVEVQQDGCVLYVVNGWWYFIYGWLQVVVDVFDFDFMFEIVECFVEVVELVC